MGRLEAAEQLRNGVTDSKSLRLCGHFGCACDKLVHVEIAGRLFGFDTYC